MQESKHSNVSVRVFVTHSELPSHKIMRVYRSWIHTFLACSVSTNAFSCVAQMICILWEFDSCHMRPLSTLFTTWWAHIFCYVVMLMVIFVTSSYWGYLTRNTKCQTINVTQQSSPQMKKNMRLMKSVDIRRKSHSVSSWKIHDPHIRCALYIIIIIKLTLNVIFFS